MNLIQLLNTLDEANISLILRCLLDRVPILTVGTDEWETNDLVNDIASYLDFRTELVYYTDFVGNDDYEEILANEENDYEVKRSVILCHTNAAAIAIQEIHQFRSWIIGITADSDNEEKLITVKEGLFEAVPYYLILDVRAGHFTVTMEGKEFPRLDLNFEKQLYKDAVKDTEIAIERMKRVLAKKINMRSITDAQLDALIDFSNEEKELKKNIFRKELLEFYQAAKRASYILNRMLMLEQMGMGTSLAEKTLMSTISYERAPSTRIIAFIHNEWGQNYESYLKGGKSSNFGDLLESMWG